MGMLSDYTNKRQVLGGEIQPTETAGTNGNDATRRTAQNQPTETAGNKIEAVVEKPTVTTEEVVKDPVTTTEEVVTDPVPTVDDFTNELKKRNEYVDQAGKDAADKFTKEKKADYNLLEETPEEQNKRLKREKSMRTWATVADTFKNLANAYGVTQGVGTQNWGNNATEQVDYEVNKDKAEREARLSKFKADLEAATQLGRKNAAEAYDKTNGVIASRNKAKADADKQTRAEERQAERDAVTDAKDAYSEANRQVKGGYASKTSLSALGIPDDEIDAMLKAQEEEKKRKNKSANKGSSKSNKSESGYTITDNEGKKHNFKTIKEAYIQIMGYKGIPVKDSDMKHEAKMIQTVQEWQKGHGDLSVNDGQGSMRDRYLTKRADRVPDGSSPDDWA